MLFSWVAYSSTEFQCILAALRSPLRYGELMLVSNRVCLSSVHHKQNLLAYITVGKACVDGLVNKDHVAIGVPAILRSFKAQVLLDMIRPIFCISGRSAICIKIHPQQEHKPAEQLCFCTVKHCQLR